MRRASELNFVSGITQVGMRGVGSALQEEYQAAQEYGAQFFSARFVHKKGTEAVLSELPVGENCFLTIDLDVLDPSVMPAVGAPTPGGLGFRSLIDLIHGITDRMNIVGACVVELVPEADQGSLGVITAMRVVWNLIGAAARKR
jgi:agmatinase